MSLQSERLDLARPPLISVVLPVYNSEPYLAEAIESILGQTLGDFELLAVYDRSADGSGRTLEAVAQRDARVQVVHGPNQGLVAALNLGLARACGEFIARMDADDVSLPQRFQRQIDFLTAHPEIAVVGSSITLIDGTGSVIRDIDYPIEPRDVDVFLIETGSALAHPTVMARRAAMLAVGGYREAFRHGEDYDLWLRIAEKFQLANVPDRLLRYRHHDAKGSLVHAAELQLATHVAQFCAKARRAGRPDPTEGFVSLSLADLTSFDMDAGERDAIVRAVLGMPSSGSAGMMARLRRHAARALRRILPPAYFDRLRNLVRPDSGRVAKSGH